MDACMGTSIKTERTFSLLYAVHKLSGKLEIIAISQIAVKRSRFQPESCIKCPLTRCSIEYYAKRSRRRQSRIRALRNPQQLSSWADCLSWVQIKLKGRLKSVTKLKQMCLSIEMQQLISLWLDSWQLVGLGMNFYRHIKYDKPGHNH